MPGFYSLESRVQSLEASRTDGLGSLTFEFDSALDDTVVPTGSSWTHVALWAVFIDTFSAASASAENGGRVQRYPTPYWGGAISSSSLKFSDITMGTAEWEFSVLLGADLVTAPQTFLFAPLPIAEQDSAISSIMTLSIPNIARVSTNTPEFSELSSFDAAIGARHSGIGDRTLHAVFARTIWERTALLGAPLP
jgi:hypothetical protein